MSILDALAPTQLPVEDLAPLPTPPDPSPLPAPELSEGSAQPDETMISVSTVFNPYAYSTEPDLIFVSSDTVLFYVHSRVLKRTPNGPPAFQKFLKGHSSDSGSDPPASPLPTALEGSTAGSLNRLIAVPDESSVLNVILHLLYGTSPAQHSPTIEILETAVDRMPFYGIKPKDYIVPHSPLYDLLLSLAPLSPLRLYALAGHHDLHELASASSSHLLYYPLVELPREMSRRMGTDYLHDLVHLHMVRFNAMKEILLSPPKPHVPTKHCDFEEQKKLTRAWALVASYLAWDARADLSTHSMQSAFQPLTKNIVCESCVSSLQSRLKDAIARWASVQVYFTVYIFRSC
ncbi:hypothetical protein NP233_g4684 [Leucocoprinus birnbaumii]|uniref:Uncharacterized protein n=1 Tax=Leucocoprinus birnbaumii TaxID=56174 RepID=A0AAD5VWJ8_9AGAR|nr:hypothetical protein NP233_g4684 [Leucocoprinus birnbaumii]